MTIMFARFWNSWPVKHPQLTEINWMNAGRLLQSGFRPVGQKEFNGTFNVNLDLGLVKSGDRYLLTQTPVKAYENLRDANNAQYFENVQVASWQWTAKISQGDTYEVVSHFVPGKDTTAVGFSLRVSDGQKLQRSLRFNQGSFVYWPCNLNFWFFLMPLLG